MSLQVYIFRAKTELLINNGANPLQRNDTCETPAHNAAITGNLETLKLLVDKGGLSGILMGNVQSSKEMKFRGGSRQNSRKGVWTTKSAPPSSVQVSNFIFDNFFIIMLLLTFIFIVIFKYLSIYVLCNAILDKSKGFRHDFFYLTRKVRLGVITPEMCNFMMYFCI